jgi:hypothetical protein
LAAATCIARFFTSAWNASDLAQKSVSQLISINTPSLPPA